MTDFDRIRAVKKATQSRLLAIPGVHSVGIGAKRIGGVRTSEVSIAVFVTKKKPPEQLFAREIVPAEIDGIKTDVVEEEPPQLLAGERTGDPNDLTITVSPDQHVITLSGKETPGKGLLAVIDLSVTPAGKVRRDFNAFCETTGPQESDDETMTLDNIAKALASKLNEYAVQVFAKGTSITAVGAQVQIAPGPNSVLVTGHQIYVFDDHKYRLNPALDGGIQILAGRPREIGPGTLGCIARTNEPESKVVAVTCHHVVANWRGYETNLNVTVSDPHTIQFDCNDPDRPKTDEPVVVCPSITPGTVVVLLLKVMPADPSQSQVYEFFLAVKSATKINNILTTETTNDIAEKIAKWIKKGHEGIQDANAKDGKVTIDWAEGFIAYVRCNVYWPLIKDRESSLHASITDQFITFDGKVAGDDYGVYVNVNIGGAEANRSNGTFVSLTKEQALSDIADSVASSINALSIAGVTALAASNTVEINGVQEIECIISSDVRVGQPNNSFPSNCSLCSDDRIGRVIRARLDVDAALIQLDVGQRYKAEIEDIGVVSGTHAVDDEELPYEVWKRGVSTGRTKGTIEYLHVAGHIPERAYSEEWMPEPLLPKPPSESGNIKDPLHRRYTEAMKIYPDGPDPFGSAGDSGSAVVRINGETNEIVGIFFGSTGGRIAYATPIQQIEAAFDISVAAATRLNEIHTVAAPAGKHAQAIPAASMSGGTSPGPLKEVVLPNWERLREAERKVVSTAAGERYVQLIRQHLDEAQKLISTNRRVAVTWQRDCGPQIVQGVLRTVQFHGQAIPTEIEGKPISQCISGISEIFTRYGSPEFSADVAKHAPPLAQLAGLTFPQVIERLRNM